MTAVLQHSPSSHHLPSSSSSPSLSSSPNDGATTLLNRGASSAGGGYRGVEKERRGGSEEDQLPLLNLLLAAVRKSLLGCRREGGEEDLRSMEIGWPTDVRHVAHVTFDRFHGFLGLPVEFEPEVPRRAPSASAKVFGVSTDSMQCSFDTRGNSVPTILLLMQRCLYEQGGIQAEGIFRINAGNNQEEYVRDQLNTGIVPEGVDVHCLAGLIKAWFRELPTGVLDPLNPEQVMQCQSEEECVQLVKLLPPTEAALLDWAINLMADVVLEEHQNKMNARNVAMVFAPNMTQMADPLTALMYAVQVMNFLKTLILKTIKDRQGSALRNVSVHHTDPSDENGHQSLQFQAQVCSEEATDQDFVPEEPVRIGSNHASEENSTSDDTIGTGTCKSACLEDTPEQSSGENLPAIPADIDSLTHGPGNAANGPSDVHVQSRKSRTSGSMNHRKGKKASGHSAVRAASPSEKSRGVSIVSRINSKVERVEAWR